MHTQSKYQQVLTMYRREHAVLMWARVDTRFHVYPNQQPRQLAMHNSSGWWLPQPDGTWFKSPSSYVPAEDAFGPALQGAWVIKQITERCQLAEYLHVDDVPLERG